MQGQRRASGRPEEAQEKARGMLDEGRRRPRGGPEEAQGTMRKSVYPFRGLRGDAKKLWMDKKDGSERRLQRQSWQSRSSRQRSARQ